MEPKAATGEMLKKARLQQKITLDDISASTRINRKFLAEIEGGTTPEIPTIYLRAFLRAFAEHVGLDAAVVLNEYFKEIPPPAPPVVEEPLQRAFAEAVPRSRPTAPKEPPSSAQRQVKILLLLSVAIIGALAILIYWLHEQHSGPATQEISFTDIVKENEMKQKAAGIAKDSVRSVPAPKPKPPRPDSLSLAAVAGDSVWIRIVIDSVVTKEYLLTPKLRLQWKAKRDFVVSVGNASSISLTLNGMKVGPVGKPTKPVQQLRINWDTWERIQLESVKKEK